MVNRMVSGLFGLFVLLFMTPAMAENRFALIIGNNDYVNVSKLNKAVGDAQAMSSTLSGLGFDVTTLTNVTRSAFNKGLASVTTRIQPGDILVLHFSGHGVQIEGENYLLPVDVPAPQGGDKDLLKDEAISLSTIVDRIKKAGVRAHVIIIDACRDNPYANSPTRSLGQTRGLAAVAPPKGTFIMFSAGNGQTALDRLSEQDNEPTSPYTRMLIRKITVEAKPITDLARELRDEVETAAAKINHEQRPAYYDELSGGPFFFKAPQNGAVPTPLPAPTPVIVPQAPPPPRQPAQEVRREPQSPAPSSRSYHYVTGLNPYGDNFLALKAGPDISAPRLAKMGPNTLLLVTGRSGVWLRVETLNGQNGWAHSNYVTCCVQR